MSAEQHGFGLCRVEHKNDKQIHLSRRLGRDLRPHAPGGDYAFDGDRVDVEGVYGEARLDQVLGLAVAHGAEPDETHLPYRHVFISPLEMPQ